MLTYRSLDDLRGGSLSLQKHRFLEWCGLFSVVAVGTYLPRTSSSYAPSELLQPTSHDSLYGRQVARQSVEALYSFSWWASTKFWNLNVWLMYTCTSVITTAILKVATCQWNENNTFKLSWSHPRFQIHVTQQVSTHIRVVAKYILKTVSTFFPFNSFIEIYFIYHRIHPFKVHSSMVFSIFTELCNNHFNLILEQLHPKKDILYLGCNLCSILFFF